MAPPPGPVDSADHHRPPPPMYNTGYNTGYHHPWRLVRILGMTVLYLACILRSGVLFVREVVLLAVAALAASRLGGVSAAWTLAAAAAAVAAACAALALQRVEFIGGHRAGAKGYSGAHCENTIEAMQTLVAADNGPRGPLPGLHYVEIDVQETADGELVVFHDFFLAAAFPPTGANAEAYRQLQRALQPSDGHTRARPLRVRDVTSTQLASLHLAGRAGLHAPTLRQFLAAFRACKCRRPLVVEVKALQTDAAREALLQLLREHQPYAAQQEAAHPEHRNPQLGFLSLIAFPNYFARSFGEFGSRRWRQWGARLTALRIPVRCCFLEALPLLRGIPGAV